METEFTAKLFVITVLAVLLGLVLGKYGSRGLKKVGVPIADDNPVPKTLPGQPVLPWRIP